MLMGLLHYRHSLLYKMASTHRWMMTINESHAYTRPIPSWLSDRKIQFSFSLPQGMQRVIQYALGHSLSNLYEFLIVFSLVFLWSLSRTERRLCTARPGMASRKSCVVSVVPELAWTFAIGWAQNSISLRDIIPLLCTLHFALCPAMQLK